MKDCVDPIVVSALLSAPLLQTDPLGSWETCTTAPVGAFEL